MADTYHSSQNEGKFDMACGFPIMPLKTKVSGPAPSCPEEEKDVIDEAIYYFRAMAFFKNFNPSGDADKVFVYVTCFISKLLEKVAENPEAASKNVPLWLKEKFAMPSDKNFPLPFFVAKGYKPNELERFNKFAKQLRDECADRLLKILFHPEYGTMDLKFWLPYAKRKFLKVNFA